MITLNFSPAQNRSTVLVRATHFRICADGTLRGSDNSVAARYADGEWILANSRYGSFECAGPVYLRVTDARGQRECLGPFDSVRMAAGAVYTADTCLGAHASRSDREPRPSGAWREISVLTTP
jgi:hypothetical protein